MPISWRPSPHKIPLQLLLLLLLLSGVHSLWAAWADPTLFFFQMEVNNLIVLLLLISNMNLKSFWKAQRRFQSRELQELQSFVDTNIDYDNICE